MTTVATRRRKRSSNTDWKQDFYRNGYPTEVIVIEDSPTPAPDQQPSNGSTSNGQQQNHVQPYAAPPAASTRSKRPRRKATASTYQQPAPQPAQLGYPVLTPVTSLVGNFAQPAAKRRRKENGDAGVYADSKLFHCTFNVKLALYQSLHFVIITAGVRQEPIYRPVSNTEVILLDLNFDLKRLCHFDKKKAHIITNVCRRFQPIMMIRMGIILSYRMKI